MHSLGWLVLALGLSSCGDQASMAPSAEQDVPPLALQSQQSSAASPLPPLIPGATGLKPLPTAQQVQAAVPSGRADPFAPYRLQLEPTNLRLVVPVCWVFSLLASKRVRCSPLG